MDNLPNHLIIEILSRLNDSTELTRCRCVCKTLNSIALKVRSIHLYCSLDRHTKMRSPECKVTPIKTIFNKLISDDAQVPIESVSLGVVEAFDAILLKGCDDYLFEKQYDDLCFTAGLFSEGWMTKIGHGLKSISISAFWAQSDDEETNVLEVLSHNCHSLVELTLKNACLCVDNMHPMPLITRLTLNKVHMLETDLNKLMECLPCLQVLILVFISVELFEHPQIRHLNLKELKWTLPDSLYFNYVDSLTIFAPNLTKLELEGALSVALSIHAPLLSYFHFALDSAREINAEEFKNLKKLSLVTGLLCNIFSTFPTSKTVEDLTIHLSENYDRTQLEELINFSDVLTVFPNVTKLTLGYEFWSQQMFYSSDPFASAADSLRGLKQITVYLDMDYIVKALTFILYVIKICPNLTDIVLLKNYGVDLSVATSFLSLCMTQCPKVRLRWGNL